MKFGSLESHINSNQVKKNPICFGAGLLALDVILNGSPITLPKLSAGGSCGNILSILGYLGWDSFPVARLALDQAGVELLYDLKRWNIHTDYISVSKQGSTPIIIHRILKDSAGNPIHRFEFRDPETKLWLPQFKAITKDIAASIIRQDVVPQVFYFDRINPGTYELAIHLKAKGAIIYFEPSSAKDVKLFEKFLKIADIVKYSHDRILEYKESYNQIQCFLEIETHGKEGLVYRSRNNSDPNKWNKINGFALSNVKDAAGAGDWCTAGIIQQICSKGQAGLYNIKKSELEKALELGQILGALNCLYDGARGLMYSYTPKDLKRIVDICVASKKIPPTFLYVEPIIDISNDLPFSHLYKNV